MLKPLAHAHTMRANRDARAYKAARCHARLHMPIAVPPRWRSSQQSLHLPHIRLYKIVSGVSAASERRAVPC